MKFFRNRKKKTTLIPFKDVPYGTIFCHDVHIYLKFDVDEDCNCINLEHLCPASMSGNTMVDKVETFIRIEDV